MPFIQIEELQIEVLYKKIKNIHLRVYPPDGRVAVSAPRFTSERSIRSFLTSKLSWIRKQQRKIGSEKERLPKEYRSGETHYFQGREYSLEVREAGSQSSVMMDKGKLILSLPPGHKREKRQKVLEDWYRARLKEIIPPLISRYEPIMGVKVNFFGVKKMKTRWGSCNVRAGRIWLNLELAGKSPQWLESVVVHEMAHLIEPSHNRRFYYLMDKFYPRWKEVKEEIK